MKRKKILWIIISVIIASSVLLIGVYATGNGTDCGSHGTGKECADSKNCTHKNGSCLSDTTKLQTVNLSGQVAVSNLVLPVLKAVDGQSYYLLLKPMGLTSLLKLKDGDEIKAEGYLLDESVTGECHWKQEPYKDSNVVLVKLIYVNGTEYNIEEMWSKMHGGGMHGKCSH